VKASRVLQGKPLGRGLSVRKKGRRGAMSVPRMDFLGQSVSTGHHEKSYKSRESYPLVRDWLNVLMSPLRLGAAWRTSFKRLGDMIATTTTTKKQREDEEAGQSMSAVASLADDPSRDGRRTAVLFILETEAGCSGRGGIQEHPSHTLPSHAPRQDVETRPRCLGRASLGRIAGVELTMWCLEAIAKKGGGTR
jgi:hypothetical protein